MNRKSFIAIGIAVALAAGTIVLAQAPKPAATQTGDSRIDKVIEQNEQILKNQQDALKKIDEIQTILNILKRRSS